MALWRAVQPPVEEAAASSSSVCEHTLVMIGRKLERGGAQRLVNVVGSIGYQIESDD